MLGRIGMKIRKKIMAGYIFKSTQKEFEKSLSGVIGNLCNCAHIIVETSQL